MQKEIVEIAAGAFLHDIGKIAQRAKAGLSSESERIKSFVCPTGPHGHHTHLHAAFTSDFFEGMEYWLPTGLDAAMVANLASYHHRPDTPEQTIIQQADWLSAGQDRREGEPEDTPMYMRARLRSVFSSVSLRASDSKSPQAWLPVSAQALDSSTYPAEAAESGSVAKAYHTLYDALIEHLRRLQNASYGYFLEQLQWVFGLYAAFVPSSMKEASDVSLYDHSLTTAAFAAALYAYHTQTDTMETEAVGNWSRKKFRLVRGDLSGIQSYIFHFATDRRAGASKRLRARSFYLGLLTQLAAHLILTDLGLPCFNKIMDAGGHFTLLVPNTEATISSLKSVEQTVHDWLFETYHGLVNLNLSYSMELSGNDFGREDFRGIGRRLAWSTTEAKSHPFHARLRRQSVWHPTAILHPYDTREDDNTEADFFTQLGQRLPQISFMSISNSDEPAPDSMLSQYQDCHFVRPFGRFAIGLHSKYPSRASGLQTIIGFVPRPETAATSDIVNGQYLASYIPRQTDEDRPLYTRPEAVRWLAGQDDSEQDEATSSAELHPGQPKTFAHLAIDSLSMTEAGDFKGQPMLAVLKADVDRLGMIFSHGLGDKISIGRYATLSRQLDLFFRGHLTQMCLAPPASHRDLRNVYTVYAGGDDLLFVGPWGTVFDFAICLQEAFSRYTADNNSVTLSAALTVMRHNYPLAQAVAQTDHLLDRAKHEGRNRVAVFGTVLRWPDFRQALDNARFLDRLINGGDEGIKANKGFVYRLLTYYRMHKYCEKIENRKWRSHLSYDIARNVTCLSHHARERPPGLERIERMAVLTASGGEMEMLKVAATYCLYMNRGGSL